MTKFKNIKTAASGLGASTLSLLGICGMGGACALGCGGLLSAPLASFLGLSTTGLAYWSTKLLPVMTAVSGILFTVAFYSLYRSKGDSCNGPSPDDYKVNTPNRKGKLMFWIGLVLTLGIYGYTMANGTERKPSGASCDINSCTQTTKCGPGSETTKTVSQTSCKS